MQQDFKPDDIKEYPVYPLDIFVSKVRGLPLHLLVDYLQKEGTLTVFMNLYTSKEVPLEKRCRCKFKIHIDVNEGTIPLEETILKLIEENGLYIPHGNGHINHSS